MSDEQWYYETDDGRAGPVSTGELRRRIERDEADELALVGRVGSDAWASAVWFGRLVPGGPASVKPIPPPLKTSEPDVMKCILPARAAPLSMAAEIGVMP